MNAILEVPGSSSTLLVATGGGVARSTDEGASWNDSSSGLTERDVRAFCVTASGDVLAASGGSDIYRSTDSGVTWSSLGLAGTWFSAVAADSVSASTYYAASSTTLVYRSTDAGAGWSPVSLGVAINALAATAAGHAVAGTVNGVFRSTDSGATWIPSNSGLTGPGVYTLVTEAGTGATVYAGSDAGVFRSTDEGATWTPCTQPPGTFTPYVLSARGGSVWASRNGFLFRSTDSGATWISLQGTISSDTRCLSVGTSDPSRLRAGTDAKGIWLSSDGGSSWIASSAGLAARDASVLSVSRRTGRILAATGWISRSTDSGGSWTDANISFVYDIAENDGGSLIATTPATVVHSTDDGVFWTAIGLQTSPTIGRMVFDPANPIHVLGAQWANVATSTDAGATWPSISSGPDSYVITLRASPSVSGSLWAGTVSGVYRSTDGGTTFGPASAGLSDPIVFELAFDAAGRLLAGSGDGNIFRSDDGMIWAKRNTTSLSAHGIRALTAHPSRPEWIYAGTDDGVKLSTDGGQTWSGFGLPSRIVEALAFGQNATILLAGLRFGSVWSRSLVDPTGFYPVTPCRAVDTRWPAAPHGGPALTAGERTFVLAGACGVPADAKSVAVNLTVVNPAADGSLTVFPGDEVAPNASASSFRAGRTRANNATLPVSQDGNAALTVKTAIAAGTTDFIVDIVGFFR